MMKNGLSHSRLFRNLPPVMHKLEPYVTIVYKVSNIIWTVFDPAEILETI